MNKQSLRGGFSLLEIIVVITIIGFLAAVGVSVFGEVREQARDKTRAAALRQLQIAIELYKDTYGEYPDPGCGGTATWMGPGPHPAVWGDECEEYIDGLVPDFIAALPTDPLFEDEDNNGFIYRSDGDDYKVLIHQTVETQLVASYQDELARCPRSCEVEYPGNNYCGVNPGQDPSQRTYAIYSSGAICW